MRELPVVGCRIVAENGSVGVIEQRAKRLADHAIVTIIEARGYHKAGDQLVWEIPRSLIARLEREAAEAAKAAKQRRAA